MLYHQVNLRFPVQQMLCAKLWHGKCNYFRSIFAENIFEQVLGGKSLRIDLYNISLEQDFVLSG